MQGRIISRAGGTGEAAGGVFALPDLDRSVNPKGLILCSKKKILWVESRDLSQTDNSYNSVPFSKVEWWVAELLFLSLNNWGLNFLQN